MTFGSRPGVDEDVADDRRATLGRTAVVVAATFPERGGGVAARVLRADDELVAILEDPEAPLVEAERLPEDLRVEDFRSLLGVLREGPRPVALLFRRPPPRAVKVAKQPARF